MALNSSMNDEINQKWKKNLMIIKMRKYLVVIWFDWMSAFDYIAHENTISYKIIIIRGLNGYHLRCYYDWL